MVPQGVREFILLVARVVLGAVFVAHGSQKLFVIGMDATTGMFTQLGIPSPEIAAWFTALVELIGGAALILGVLMPVFSILLAVVMAGALVFVHAKSGFFAQTGGYEYVLVLGIAALAVGFSGSKYSVDGMVGGRSKQAVSG
jgi:putative oxidoreductase